MRFTNFFARNLRILPYVRALCTVSLTLKIIVRITHIHYKKCFCNKLRPLNNAYYKSLNKQNCCFPSNAACSSFNAMNRSTLIYLYYDMHQNVITSTTMQIKSINMNLTQCWRWGSRLWSWYPATPLCPWSPRRTGSATCGTRWIRSTSASCGLLQLSASQGLSLESKKNINYHYNIHAPLDAFCFGVLGFGNFILFWEMRLQSLSLVRLVA